MTLRRRWAFSVLAILLLFGLNLAVYFWGNGRRTALILELKTAVERKDLVVEIRNSIASRHRDTEVMEPLLTSGAVDLDERRLAEIRRRMQVIETKIDRLGALSGSAPTIRLDREFQDLRNAWFEVYAASPPAGGFSHREKQARIDQLLTELQADETEEAERAEREFASVAELTDRVTLVIFAATSVLAIGIAVWFSRFLRSAFARYVTSEVAESVLQTPSGLALGGEKRRITVLMADLRGFSAMSERIDPEKVVAVINNFLGVMTEIIVESGGMIDEFIGDAILVIFGAPVERQDHAEAAVECALGMQLAMREVNARNRTADLPMVEMGIGIHTAECVVGNIGSEKRTKYGAVGAGVNLAARIEANTVGGQILISQATFDEVGSDLRIDGRLEIHPKGLEGPVKLFEIGGLSAPDRDRELALPRLDEALVQLEDRVGLRFAVMEGSRTGKKVWDGELLGLSERAAIVRTSADVAPLANLRLELLQGSDAAARPFFAKVLSVKPRDETFVARFTSVDPETASLLERLRT